MAHLKNLDEIEVVVNSRYMGEWPLKVGQYILNFGAIELMSYQWLSLIEPSRDEFNKNVDRTLSQRIDRIGILVDLAAHLSDDQKAELKNLWVFCTSCG